MKIKEYPKATSLANTDAFVVETSAGTKYVEKSVLSNGDEVKPLDVVVEHRNIYRGKNLGTSFTTAQKTAIKNGTFDDLYVGDYWVIGGVNWRIADIDYWVGRKSNSSMISEHHLAIVPDSTLYNTQYNSGASLSNGYAGSSIRSTGLNSAITTRNNAFGESNILRVDVLLCNAVSDGRPTGLAAYAESIQNLSPIMVFGTTVIPHITLASNTANTSTTNFTQLKLFELDPKAILASDVKSYWLSDFSYFGGSFMGTDVTNDGSASYTVVTNSIGVRPVFAIKG